MPVAEITDVYNPAASTLPPVTLPVALIVLVDNNTPLTKTLPPVILPVALTVAPIKLALALPIVAAFTVAEYIVPVPLTTPAPYKILPPVILALACIVPLTLIPVVVVLPPKRSSQHSNQTVLPAAQF